MENSPVVNSPGTDLRDEALRRAKKKYKKRRSDSSPDGGRVERDETLQEDGMSDCPSATVLLNGISYKDRVTGNFDAKDSNWEEWTEEDGDDNMMFDDTVSDEEEGDVSDSHAADPAPLNPTFRPWMIVQRRSRRPVKPMVEKGKNKIASNQGHESRNRFQSLQGMKESAGEKLKASTKAVFQENFKDSIGDGRKLWKPKKGQGVKALQKSSGKDIPKDLNKGSESSIGFGSSLAHGPPPGFSFKAGSTKPVVFDPKRLEDLLLSPKLSSSGRDDEMCLPSDAVSLPPQQPPSVREGVDTTLGHADSDGGLADTYGITSAVLSDGQDMLANNCAQSNEPGVSGHFDFRLCGGLKMVLMRWLVICGRTQMGLSLKEKRN
ncbi:hypothetical protein COLO4_11596 [Corchorus olitorius]|uniref:Uncharacterized protein n=1 Tax=Corchorus olitorius TaxID=93759 RepID=A0A1R3K416_9ROSI|nr:hypothetical protein COLO4_11596 [Corchorus olitorius]